MSGPVQRSRSYLGLSFVVEHQPSSGQVHGTAILLLPPMGYEDTCAYRPLRVLADQLAQQGHLVQRLDWPGLGDSAGNAETPELIQQCITTVRQAAAALRARGLRRVAAVGVRAGALLALAAGGAAIGGLDEVVLWAMPPRGKAYMREESTFHRMAAAAFGAVPDTAPRLPEGSVEAGGFWYSPSTVAAMNKLDSVELAAQATFERVLLIERDGASPSAPLLAAFGQAGSPVQVQEGSGLRDLLENPYQAKMDPALAEGIVSWFKNGGPSLSVGPAGGSPELRMTGVTGALAGPGEVARVLERPWLQPGGAGELSGILCLPARPVQPGTPWTIFYNAGGIRRCGPNRLWTGAARALAARGRPSLRIDVRDVGDSDGTSVPHGDLEAMYAESSIDDATAAYDWVEAQSAAAIDVVGLCSGAFLGVQVAARRRVRRALLFNGLALVWNDDARASGMTSQIRGSLLNTRRWKRLLTGRIDAKALGLALLSKGGIAARNVLARVQGAPPPDEVEELLRRVQDRGTTLLLVASEGDPSVAYLERHVRPPYRPAMTTISGVDHTIRPVWAQSRVIGLIVGTPAATG